MRRITAVLALLLFPATSAQRTGSCLVSARRLADLPPCLLPLPFWYAEWLRRMLRPASRHDRVTRTSSESYREGSLRSNHHVRTGFDLAQRGNCIDSARRH